MKHAYIPRTTTYNLNPEEELNDLRMSEQVRPLYEHVKKFIRETVDPMSVEFAKLGEKKTDRWSFTPEQLAVLQKAKDKAKEVGLWNFFLPDDEIKVWVYDAGPQNPNHPSHMGYPKNPAKAE